MDDELATEGRHVFRRYSRTGFGALLLLVAGISVAQVQTKALDTILFTGRVFTASEAHPFAEAIAIQGARIP